MKITCVSDTHSRHKYIDTKSLTNTDILIHAGDFTGNGSKQQAIDFLQWFEALPVRHKIFVAGNHDGVCTSSTWSEMLTQYAPNCHYLCNSSVTIDNLVIWGSPYSNTFGHWHFMKEDFELYDIWEQIPANANIVITHGPAYGTADKVDNAHNRDPHVGSQSLKDRLKKLKKLKLHITGHVHEAQGTYLGKHTTVNASICNLNYVPLNPPISLHIE